MNKTYFFSRQTALQTLAKIAFAIEITFACAGARGSDAYLARVGPPPLRFEMAVAMDPFPTVPFSLPKTNEIAEAKPADSEPTPPVVSTTPTTISAASQPAPAAQSIYPGLTVPDTTEKNSSAKNVSSAPQTASDLLNVSPQMLTDYLKPPQVPVSQPQVIQTVPMPFGFLPPLLIAPQPPHPDSSAVYKSQ